MKTYRVITENDVEGRSTKTLGYATGEPVDIKAYFNDRKFYELRLEEINILNISSLDVELRTELIEKQKELMNELDRVNELLGK